MIGSLFGGPPLGISVFTAGLILGVMILPFVSSIMRDVFETVPPMLRESAFGLGATTARWSGRSFCRSPVSASLAAACWGSACAWRDHGSDLCHRQCASPPTLAIGPRHDDLGGHFANEFNEATGDLYLSSLTLLGLILYVITLIVLGIAKVMLTRLQRQAGR